MTTQISSHNHIQFVECLPGEMILSSEKDALELVAACGEHLTPRLLFYSDNVSPDFFDLKTRLAGEILLKFTNYRIKAAAVLTREQATQGRFGEMVLETNRGSQFRVFYERTSAVEWLTAS